MRLLLLLLLLLLPLLLGDKIDLPISELQFHTILCTVTSYLWLLSEGLFLNIALEDNLIDKIARK